MMDQSLPTEIRIHAFRCIILCKPSTATLQMLAKWMNEEPNLHVVSYCFSYLVGISKTKLPGLKKW
jgi:hypothetical protein